MSKYTLEKYQEIDTKILELIKIGKTSKEISNELNINSSTIFRRCRKLGCHIPNYHNALKFDNTIFDNIDTEEKAYWLGFFYADGNVHSTINSVSFTLKGSDYNHLVKFCNFIHYQKQPRLSTIKSNGKEYSICKISVCDKHLKQRLIELGCPPNKSLILKFPDINIFSDKNLVYHFIRGYVDGDGCLTFSKNGRLGLNIVGTKEMLEGIISIFPDNFRSVRKIKRLKTNVYTIGNCGHNADIVCNKLYKDALIYLDRKYNRFAVLSRDA